MYTQLMPGVGSVATGPSKFVGSIQLPTEFPPQRILHRRPRPLHRHQQTYEKWSSGADSLFGGLHAQAPSVNQHDSHGFKDRMGMRHPSSSNDGMMELTTKLLSQTAINSPPMPPSTPQLQNNPVSHSSALYPPKSQIKRQKMIYHCKFGEFGILEA